MCCFFCKIVDKLKERDDILFEDDHVFVMMDQDDAVKGHVLVVWKDHKLNFSDLTESESKYFSDAVYKVEKELLKELRVGKSIILKSGGLESHFHFHIYPVPENIQWQTVKDIFDKEIQYTFIDGEKEKFIEKMQERLKNR
ncbi:MAG: HIT family protein [Parcubacteria group bacterium]|jgi:diadenosine tetraphosphate (Ap4A) HIT family hydrolase